MNLTYILSIIGIVAGAFAYMYIKQLKAEMKVELDKLKESMTILNNQTMQNSSQLYAQQNMLQQLPARTMNERELHQPQLLQQPILPEINEGKEPDFKNTKSYDYELTEQDGERDAISKKHSKIPVVATNKRGMSEEVPIDMIGQSHPIIIKNEYESVDLMVPHHSAINSYKLKKNKAKDSDITSFKAKKVVNDSDITSFKVKKVASKDSDITSFKVKKKAVKDSDITSFKAKKTKVKTNSIESFKAPKKKRNQIHIKTEKEHPDSDSSDSE